MRSGERASAHLNAKLRQDGLNAIGQKRLIKGGPYIAKLVETELISASHELIFVAPSPICRDTLVAIIKHSGLAATYASIREESKIHTGERQKEWEALVSGFTSVGEIKTLADLKQAGAMAQENHGFAEDFLQSEGTRIVEFVVGEVAKLPAGSTVLCIMNSPVVETVWLELWRNSPPMFREARPLDSIPMLDNLDSIAFGVREGSIAHVLEYRNEEKIRRKLEDDAAVLKLKQGLVR